MERAKKWRQILLIELPLTRPSLQLQFLLSFKSLPSFRERSTISFRLNAYTWNRKWIYSQLKFHYCSLRATGKVTWKLFFLWVSSEEMESREYNYWRRFFFFLDHAGIISCNVYAFLMGYSVIWVRISDWTSFLMKFWCEYCSEPI